MNIKTFKFKRVIELEEKPSSVCLNCQRLIENYDYFINGVVSNNCCKFLLTFKTSKKFVHPESKVKITWENNVEVIWR